MVQAQDSILAAMLDRITTTLPEPARALARPLYGALGPADLAAVSETVLTAGVLSLWHFMAERPQGTVRLRVHQPDWAEGGVVAEIINDDMPFLVDSTVAIFNRHGLSIELLAHPILPIRRDESGRLTALGDGPRESVMSIHLSGSRDVTLLAEIERDLVKTLADVRAAVTDWRAMLHRLSLATAELDDPALAASGIAAEDIAETKAFLRWLADNHFTLLGYRDYRYEDTPDGKVMRVLDDSNLGIMRDQTLAVLHGHRNLTALPPDIRAFLEAPQLLFVAKANQRSPVHRPVHMDIIGVKRLDATGRVVAERRFIGLFTSGAYSELPSQIPILRQKVASVMDAAGFAPASHDGKALAQILDTYPRDELFTIPTNELFDIALGVLRLQDRRRIALFLRRDPFERFVSCLVYVPRDRYDAALRDRFNALLAEAFCGSIAASYIHLSEAPLARLHVIVKTSPGQIPVVDIPALEAKLIAAGRNWADDLMQAVTSLPQGGTLARRYAGAFDAAYCDRHSPDQAVADLLRIEGLVGDMPACRLENRPGAAPDNVTFRLYRRDKPVPLSDVLPILEHHGLRVLTENPYRIHPADQGVVWLHDFEAESIDRIAIDADAVRSRFEAGFLAGWAGVTEEDGFNRLILSAGLDWREAGILRSYAQYLRQIGFTYSRRYIEATLAKYPAIAARLVSLFHARLDPNGTADTAALEATLRQELDAVAVADEDRILRRYLDLILATLRTNYYQRQPDGQPKPYLAIKLDSAHLDGLPKPRPHVEIWVSSPDVEAVHLRGGKVARGGIRWSDRREDFRTEILGLIKAQMVKNAVIVPVGSKGGFVVKRPPPADAGRPALMAQVIACYRTLMAGLLDLTDNRQGDRIVPPADVRRLDGDDPYLVVAADKGTATFSDIANGIAQDYGFWLDDAFASGGSAGYDHKALGITAAGAWVAVERHLREIGIDLHRQGLSVVGVGDMSGDVFGNGLLHSDQLRLVAAFDHRHIFLDPDPDPARSFAERKRLFALAGSSWADYDAALLSPGGMIIPRSAKSVTISAQAMAVLGLETATLTPADLMQAILKAPVDLLWFGGIGTYIKAASETNAQIGDRANDAIRIDGREVRAKVVGEGANLGVTQPGRIEYALRGGRINTDAVDNSAGVDCSDHEVNIKILTADLIGRGEMDRSARDTLLALMAAEVSQLVLRDNDRQTFTLSMAERDGALMVDAAPRLIQRFARTAGLDRTLEALPEDSELASRSGLVRPELAVLLAFAKMDLYNALLASSLPDDPALAGDLITYFPTPLQRDHADAIRRHGLRREITATQITNSIIDRGGIDFVAGLVEETGASPAAIAAGFCAARDLFDLPALWAALDAMDQVEQAAAQIDLARATAQELRQAVAWLMRTAPHGLDAAPMVATLADPWRAGLAALRAGTTPGDAAGQLASFQAGVRMLDVLPLVHQTSVAIDRAAALWAEIGERFQFDKLTQLAQATPQPDSWSRRAVAGLLMDLAGHRQRIAARILARSDSTDWQNADAALLMRWDSMLAGLLSGPVDLARLAIAEHTLRSQIL